MLSIFQYILGFTLDTKITVGRDSSVGRATGYGLDGRGIKSRWGGEIYRTCPDRPWGPPNLLYNGCRVFPWGKERPGRDADHSPPSSVVVKKEYSTSTLPMGRTACTEPQWLYKGALYITKITKVSWFLLIHEGARTVLFSWHLASCFTLWHSIQKMCGRYRISPNI
jgi:hypothetical protein